MPEINREQIEAYRDSPSRLVTSFDREMAHACLAALDRAEAAECERDKAEQLRVLAVQAVGYQSNRAEAAETALQAWHKAFGTTQPTHAVARLEAADCEADQLAEVVHSLEEQRASVIEERDEAQAEAADLRSQLAACAAWREQDKAEVIHLHCMLSGNEKADVIACEGCAQPSVTTDSEGVPLCHECYVGCINDDVVKPLQAEIARLKAENMCDACAGQGTALSGPCMCGGTGKMSDAAVYLRSEVARLKDQVAALVFHAQQSGTYLAGPMAVAATAWREQVRREAYEEAAQDYARRHDGAMGIAIWTGYETTAWLHALAGAGEEARP